MFDKTNLSNESGPLIIAHRGASAVERENTLEAFEAAIEMNADAIEIDVRRTRDGIFVIHHDPTITQSTTPISDLDYSDAEQQAHDAGFHLPTLAETIDLCKGKIPLDIELKEQSYEGDVIAFLRERMDSAQLVITSFNDDTIKRTKSVWPEVKTGLILGIEPPVSIRTRLGELFPVGRLRRCGADFVAVHYRLLKFGFVRRLRCAGYPVWVWTVDDIDLARKLVSQQVAAVITNRPDRMDALRD